VVHLHARGEHSYKERCQRIDKVILSFFGSNRLLQDLTAKDVETFRQEQSQGRAVATVNVDHSYLKHMLKQAIRRDLVRRNMTPLVSAPKPKNARSRVLEPEEGSRLYGAALGWFKSVLLTGYHTGMKLEEILTLTWDRVDLEKGWIFLPGHLNQDRAKAACPNHANPPAGTPAASSSGWCDTHSGARLPQEWEEVESYLPRRTAAV
jgi:integrase